MFPAGKISIILVLVKITTGQTRQNNLSKSTEYRWNIYDELFIQRNIDKYDTIMYS